MRAMTISTCTVTRTRGAGPRPEPRLPSDRRSARCPGNARRRRRAEAARTTAARSATPWPTAGRRQRARRTPCSRRRTVHDRARAGVPAAQPGHGHEQRADHEVHHGEGHVEVEPHAVDQRRATVRTEGRERQQADADTQNQTRPDQFGPHGRAPFDGATGMLRRGVRPTARAADQRTRPAPRPESSVRLRASPRSDTARSPTARRTARWRA
jgi:hypothetical protein